jgi:histidyl-tRNA synthetase
MSKLSTSPYKGTRDFYPEDYRLHRYMFGVVRAVLYRFGYEEYMAPLLEPTDLYRAKSGEEIVNEQTYSFEDRGGRDVTIRPEMTPSLARMVGRRAGQYSHPLRWFSIPNLYRYERPQRGRLREHYQVNVDLFGSESAYADIEVLDIARQLLEEFGASQEDFRIHLNDRQLIQAVYTDLFGFNDDQRTRSAKLIDRKDKMHPTDFRRELREICAENEASSIEMMLEAEDYDAFADKIRSVTTELPPRVEARMETMHRLVASLEELGITNTVFDFSLMRGFDYYTGLVFEVFDTHPDNRRALFGGGRYDNLLEIFDKEPTGAIGFGMGDVPLYDFLSIHGLLPTVTAQLDAYICPLNADYVPAAYEYGARLRAEGLQAVVDYSGRKLASQLKQADAKHARYAVCLGPQELENGTVTLRTLATGEEVEHAREESIEIIRAEP